MTDDELYAQGRILALRGYYAEALPILDAVTRSDQLDGSIRCAAMRHAAWPFRRGHGAYETALKLNPDNVNTHEYKGEAFVTIGAIDRARTELAIVERLCGNRECEQYEDSPRRSRQAIPKIRPTNRVHERTRSGGQNRIQITMKDRSTMAGAGEFLGRLLVASLFWFSGVFDMALNWPAVARFVAQQGCRRRPSCGRRDDVRDCVCRQCFSYVGSSGSPGWRWPSISLRWRCCSTGSGCCRGSSERTPRSISSRTWRWPVPFALLVLRRRSGLETSR